MTFFPLDKDKNGKMTRKRETLQWR